MLRINGWVLCIYWTTLTTETKVLEVKRVPTYDFVRHKSHINLIEYQTRSFTVRYQRLILSAMARQGFILFKIFNKYFTLDIIIISLKVLTDFFFSFEASKCFTHKVLWLQIRNIYNHEAKFYIFQTVHLRIICGR